MKKKFVNFSLPAKLHSFETDEKDPRFSRGKLNIFYIGETADKRLFDEDFSSHLIKTAAYAPVVAYYDEEKEDFIGHHPTEQSIYGIIDPKTEPTFEVMDDGNVWAVCDVVLYTERPGKVGEIAKKIIGHSQSLELKPDTVEYVINYDEKKHFKNIQFKNGEIFGVSVLGNDQSPAFTGSAFFSLDNFEEKMRTLKEYCEKTQENAQNTEEGGSEMHPDFMELSWQDVSEKVAQAVQQEYQDACTMLAASFDGHVVILAWYYQTGESKYLDIKYTLNEENGEVTLGEVVEVRPTFVPVKEKPAEGESFTEQPATQPEPEQAPATEEPSQTDPQVGNNDNQQFTDSQDGQGSPSDEGATAQDGNESQTQEDPSSASFTDSEQQELDAIEKEKKVDLLNTYKESLTDEQFEDFSNHLDDYTVSDLAIKFLSIVKENSQKAPAFRTFQNPMSSSEDDTQTKNDDLGHIVAKVLNK